MVALLHKVSIACYRRHGDSFTVCGRSRRRGPTPGTFGWLGPVARYSSSGYNFVEWRGDATQGVQVIRPHLHHFMSLW